MRMDIWCTMIIIAYIYIYNMFNIRIYIYVYMYMYIHIHAIRTVYCTVIQFYVWDILVLGQQILWGCWWMGYCWVTQVWSDWKWKNLHYATLGLKWFTNAGGCRLLFAFACLIDWIRRLVSHLPSWPWHCKMPASTCKKTCQGHISPIQLLTYPRPPLAMQRLHLRTSSRRHFLGYRWANCDCHSGRKAKNRWNRERTGRFWQIRQLCNYEPLWQIIRFAISDPA